MSEVTKQVAANGVRAVIDLWRRSAVADHGADPPYSGIQHGGQPLEVSVRARGDEFLCDELMFGFGDVGKPGRSGGELAPRASGELAAGANGPAHGRGDLVERDLEDVVKHYSEVSPDRLHNDAIPLVRPLTLSAEQSTDLVAFLRTLSVDVPSRPAPPPLCP